MIRLHPIQRFAIVENIAIVKSIKESMMGVWSPCERMCDLYVSERHILWNKSTDDFRICVLIKR